MLFFFSQDGALIPEPDKRGKHFRQSKSPPSKVTSQQSVRKKDTPLQPQELNKPGSAKTKAKTKKRVPTTRIEPYKGPMFAQGHPVTHIDPNSGAPLVSANGGPIQETPPHTYIPNGELYFPGHYLDSSQMAHAHMNPIPSCQKMLEAPAYFMAGMKENTFHQ